MGRNINVRMARRVLWLGASCCLGVVAMVAWLLFSKPLIDGHWQVPINRTPREPDRPDLPTVAPLTEEDFQYVWSKPLQRPLTDPQPITKPIAKFPPALKKAPVAKIPLKAELLGTLIDDNQTDVHAWLKVNNQAILVGVGDVLEKHVGKPLVKQIVDRQVTIELQGTEHAITLRQNEAILELSEGE